MNKKRNRVDFTDIIINPVEAIVIGMLIMAIFMKFA